MALMTIVALMTTMALMTSLPTHQKVLFLSGVDGFAGCTLAYAIAAVPAEGRHPLAVGQFPHLLTADMQAVQGFTASAKRLPSTISSPS